MPHSRKNRRQSGIALVTVMMVSVVMSLMMLGFFLVVNGEQQISAADRDHTAAFYGAEAGLEKMNADLANLFSSTASPTPAQINALTASSMQPSVPGIIFPAPDTDYSKGGYTIGYTLNENGTLASTQEVIGGTSALAGLEGDVTPFTLTVVAQGANGVEVKMSRQVQLVSVPVFEYGIFSATDLSFFAGPDFNFGGRVATNGNLYLAEGDGATLTFTQKVTAAKDVIRTNLSNGWPVSDSYTGTVDVDTAPGTYRALAQNEGSLVGMPGSAVNSNWQTISLTDYNGNLLSSETGATALNMGNILGNINPIEIIRRPYEGESASSPIGLERLYNQASLIILLSDQSSDLPEPSWAVPLDGTLYPYPDACHPPVAASPGPSTDAANVNPDPPITPPTGYQDTAGTYESSSGFGQYLLPGPTYTTEGATPTTYSRYTAPTGPPAAPAAPVNSTLYPDVPTTVGPGAPLLGGYFEAIVVDSSGGWHNATADILSQGIEMPESPGTNGSSGTPASGVTENGASCTDTSIPADDPYTAGTYYPILEMEQLIDDPTEVSQSTTSCSTKTSRGKTTTTCSNTSDGSSLADPRVVGSTSPYDYLPLAFYDTREGELRDVDNHTSCASGQSQPCGSLNGFMYPINLNVGNLQKYFAGTLTGTTLGGTALDNSGYIVYFSDRRTNNDPNWNSLCPNCYGDPETAEYGNEDIINPSVSTGMPDGILEPAEDVNGNGILDTYGATPIWDSSVVTADGATENSSYNEQTAWNAAGLPTPTPETRVNGILAQTNPPLFFRRALRLVNGQMGNLPPVATADCSSSTAGGFTLVAENPIYIQGDYNAINADGFNDGSGACHVPASVMGDAVTLLSNSWTDQESMNYPDTPDSRNASSTTYRMAVIGGKNLSFTQPTGYSTYQDFGTDGGVHNFLRYLENWGGGTVSYDGSIVSLYTSRQATGVYKCCTTVYSAPASRNYQFDTAFSDIGTLPPGTPRFTDINNLSFQQDVLPNQ